MIINKLVIQGVDYKRTLNFNKGLTIISGDKTSGKSLVLSLIDYVLGKGAKIDLKVQKELNAHCDNVFLEININGTIFTFNRHLKTKTSNIKIYYCHYDAIEGYTPKTLSIDETMKFLMNELNINEYKIIKHKNHSTQKTLETVSFRDIFRYVYTNQHALGTHDFLGNKTPFKKNKNPHAFKIMFNLVEQDATALKQEIVETQNALLEDQKMIFGLGAYLKDKNAEDFNYLSSRAKSITKDITKQKKSKETIIKNNKSNNDNENKMYIKLKKDLEGIANALSDFRNSRRKLEVSIKSKQILIEEYQAEIIEINATLEVNYKLIIPEQSLECPLCSSLVNLESERKQPEQNAEKTLLKIRKDLESKIKIVTNLIDKDMQQIQEIDYNMNRLTQKESILKNAIAEFAKDTDVPFLSELNSINILINQMTKELETIKESMRIHRKIDEKHKNIEKLTAKIERLEGELKKLNVNEDIKKDIFDYLDKEYKKFMKRFKYSTKNDTFIHRDSFIPYYDGSGVYSHESGGLLECMQLSYLAAILKSKEKGYAEGHPGLLLLDSLSKYVGTLRVDLNPSDNDPQLDIDNNSEERINDPEVYDEFYKILIELSSSHQIILVENTPPQISKDYVKYTFLFGEKGLINLEVNEFADQ
ncbi:hypothetical protein AAHH17_03955 [Lysinibacillus capsici]